VDVSRRVLRWGVYQSYTHRTRTLLPFFLIPNIYLYTLYAGCLFANAKILPSKAFTYDWAVPLTPLTTGPCLAYTRVGAYIFRAASIVAQH
jgi:hypothetical protein